MQNNSRKPSGWDAADALAEGWDRTPVDALIATSKHALRRYRTNDATVEKLSELLDENPSG